MNLIQRGSLSSQKSQYPTSFSTHRSSNANISPPTYPVRIFIPRNKLYVFTLQANPKLHPAISTPKSCGAPDPKWK